MPSAITRLSLAALLLGLWAAPVASLVAVSAPAFAQDEPHGSTGRRGPGGDNEPGEAHESTMTHYPILHPRSVDWSFAGPFGSFDRQQLQRGYQVYKEVCASCHAMSYVAFRNLSEEGGPGFTDEQVKALAATFQVQDGPNDAGDMFERPGRPSDRFPSPFPNENAARASNSGAYPPDLSLITKARGISSGFPGFIFDIFTQYQESGADYTYSLLTGYQEPPAGVTVPEGQYYNPHYIAGSALAMPPPLSDGLVDYAQEGVPETVDQYARDVTAFLAWAAEPHMEARKATGLVVMVFLILLAGLLYYTKRKVWAAEPH